MSHERLKCIKDTLITAVESQIYNLEEVDTEELGDVIDMIKDLEEAIYYCSVIKAMEESESSQSTYRRDMDKEEGKMYYTSGNGRSTSNGNSSNRSSNGSNGRISDSSHDSAYYEEYDYDMTYQRDEREGKSPLTRKTYMESKSLHKDKNTQMKELEKYMQELTSDITEMIQGATAEEKQLLQSKIATLATKVSQV